MAAKTPKPKPANFSPGSLPLGILGGGQLARMLVLSAHAMGIPVRVLSENPDDPAAQVCPLWVQGSLSDARTLRNFLKSCSVVTFESEFLDASLLAKLSAETSVRISPQPELMALVQDRLTQKEMLERGGLPTAPWLAVNNILSAEEAFKMFGGKVVYKQRRFGYDGYGTFVVRNDEDLRKFLPRLQDIKHGFIAEKFIPFKRELAVMVARSVNGETVQLPFVESYQENSRCLWVKGPLAPSPTLRSLGRKLEKFLDVIDYTGIMGIELFDTGRGLLVNELAPRVHNSGHYSMNALSRDQFALHIDAVMGSALGKPECLARGFAMMNLLGSSDAPVSWRLPADVALHWYGKSENRKGRKMGHINAVGNSPAAALQTVFKRRSDFKV